MAKVLVFSNETLRDRDRVKWNERWRLNLEEKQKKSRERNYQ
jgi:hypothetical protein